MLAVVAGLFLAGVDVVSVDSRSEIVKHAIELALIMTLFSDGLLVERELLARHWGPAARALIIAMPVTMALLAVCAKLLFPELDWAECFLLGAVLSPTDPVVTSTVVTMRRVPGLVRHTLNLESGLNDGLALPLVLFFLVLAEPGGDAAQLGAGAARRGGVGSVDRRRARVRGRLRAAAAARAGRSRATTRACTRSGSRCSPTGSRTRPSATA